MDILNKLRAQRAEKLKERAAAVAAMEATTKSAEGEARSDLTAEETKAFDTARAKVTAIDTDLEPLNERIGELEQIEERTQAAAKFSKEIYVQTSTSTNDVLNDRSATRMQVVDA